MSFLRNQAGYQRRSFFMCIEELLCNLEIVPYYLPRLAASAAIKRIFDPFLGKFSSILKPILKPK